MLITKIIGYWEIAISAELPSIIIPARNEAANIKNVLNAVISQSYPSNLVEIIVVDDHSTDQTSKLVQMFSDRVRLISLQDLPGKPISKKQALLIGIEKSTNDIIVTLDADCVPVSTNWLCSLIEHVQRRNMVAVTGPVCCQTDGSVLQNFQAMENAGMMVVTGAGYQNQWYEMANGANLCFRKHAFIKVNGYKGNDQLASGDDMFLFEKFKKMFPNGIGFVADKQAIVNTKSISSLNELIRQRIRWGTKNKRMESLRLKFCLGYVFGVNVIMLGLIASFLFVKPNIQLEIVFLFALKAIVDYLLLKRGTTFLNQQSLLKHFTINAFLYPIMLVITGFASIFKTKYSWKGRKVS
jgi:cellulose synthase/poly-beta-1,6-N-acetylglucosamine synthase-like glycosyltransferase